MKTSIIKPSSSFKRNCVKKNAIATSVDSFLYQTNTAIEIANKENKNRIALRLPSSFSVPDGINHHNFQIEVYYNIVNVLETKGYKVKIKSDNFSIGSINLKSSYASTSAYGDNNIIYISWETEDDFDRNEMLKKLKKITI